MAVRNSETLTWCVYKNSIEIVCMKACRIQMRVADIAVVRSGTFEHVGVSWPTHWTKLETPEPRAALLNYCTQ